MASYHIINTGTTKPSSGYKIGDYCYVKSTNVTWQADNTLTCINNDSGTYTPNLIYTLNVNSALVNGNLNWVKHKGVIDVFGIITLSPITLNTLMTVNIPLPVTSILISMDYCTGVATYCDYLSGNFSAMIKANITSNTAQLDLLINSGNKDFRINFSYRLN